MNGFVTLTSSTPCWHDGAQVSEGPTTHQRNWWCPACGAQRTTFPGDSAEAHFAARTARSQAPAVVDGPPDDWAVYNSGACVADGISYAEALDYLTPERLARDWSAVCVVTKDNISKPPVQGSES